MINRNRLIRRLISIGCLTIIALVAAKCSVDRITADVERRRASDGFYGLLSYLPHLPQAEIVGLLRADSDFTAYGKTCYYSDGWIVLESSSSETETIALYKSSLPPLGWNEVDKWPSGSKFFHSDNDKLIFTEYRGSPPPIIENSLDFASLKRKYKSIIFIDLVYMLPSRDES